MADIYAVVGDIGGCNEVLPAIKALPDKFSVKWFVDEDPKAKAVIKLKETGISYETRGPLANDCPKVIVVGTSATACMGQIDWTRFGHERGIPVVWVEDLFGTGSRNAVLGVSPDLMLTIHQVAADIARRARPELEVKIVGKPSFEKLPKLFADKESIRQRVREAKGIGDHFLVHWIFPGEPFERAWEQLYLYEREEWKGTYRQKFSHRFHLKHPEKDKLYEKARELFGDQYVEVRDIENLDIILAADMVVSDWRSTDSLVALLAHIPTVTVMFPNTLADAMERQGSGYRLGIPPLLFGEDPFWGADAVSDMLRAINSTAAARYQAVKITKQRADRFNGLLKPGSAERIAEEIMRYVA